ncbi:MAG: hypothetical protein mread185_000308 [Mycoplasmataceae bacterium]|nr:MAG: hypothetical protein mread185_000308 [Mycoplasmataceae bacterium]
MRKCKNCDSYACLLEDFNQGGNMGLIYNYEIEGENKAKCLAKLNFDFEIVPDGDKGLFWGNLYRVKAHISDDSGRKIVSHLGFDVNNSHNSNQFTWKSDAQEALNKFVSKLNQQRNIGLAKLQTNIIDPKNKQNLISATPTPDQISELIKQQLSEIDLAKYLAQIDALSTKNQDNINLSYQSRRKRSSDCSFKSHPIWIRKTQKNRSRIGTSQN